MAGYFFKVGDKDYLVDVLRQFLYSRFYVKTPPQMVCSTVFDRTMETMLADFRRFHGFPEQTSIFSMGSLLDEAVYRKMGREMTDGEIDHAALHDPTIRTLLYGDPCSTWTTVSSVIPKEKFVGWGKEGITKNCFDYCKAQLDEAGHKMKSPWWGDGKTLQPDIYQLYLAADVAGMKKGVQPRGFVDGIEYMKTALANKMAVVVGVDDAPNSPNKDQTTDHFVTVVGMGTDVKGKYFHFFDNATGDQKQGTSDQNRLYPDCLMFKLAGTADNTFAQESAYKGYTVSQIRETK